MKNNYFKLLALAATLLVATQPLLAAWYDDIFKPKYFIGALVGACGLYLGYQVYSSFSAQPSQEELKEKLFSSIKKNDLETIKQIVSEYPDLVNVKNKDGNTPLHDAVFRGNFEIVKLLIQHDTDVNAKNTSDETPLHWAVYWNKFDIAKLLIENKADVNAKNNDGVAPLHLAVETGNLDIVKLLIESGADPNIQNYGNQTPLGYANVQPNPNQDIIDYLMLAEESYQDYVQAKKTGPWDIAPQSCLLRACLGAAPLQVTVNDNTYFLDLTTIYKAYCQNPENIKEIRSILASCNFDKLGKEQKEALQKIGFPLTTNEFDIKMALAQKTQKLHNLNFKFKY